MEDYGLPEAQPLLDQHEHITLSERDSARFIEMIEKPSPPTIALQKAMAEYRRLKAAHPESNL